MILGGELGGFTVTTQRRLTSMVGYATSTAVVRFEELWGISDGGSRFAERHRLDRLRHLPSKRSGRTCWGINHMQFAVERDR